jgi:prepilin-type processing-associated H-X9-DG protein
MSSRALGDVGDLTRVVFCGDGETGPDGENPSFDMRHQGRMLGGFLDGHVAVSDPPEIPALRYRIAFTSNRDGNDEIYLMAQDGTGQLRLTNHAADDGEPYFTPDGRQIVFTSTRDGNQDLYRMGLDGGGLTRLTTDPANDSAATIASDGTVYFASTRTGTPCVFRLGADGSAVQITEGESPAIAPDGRMLAVITGVTKSVLCGDVNSASWPCVHAAPEQDGWPAFSPDGLRIAFTSELAGTSDFALWSMNTDGSGLTQLTPGGNSDGDAIFTPDGVALIFAIKRGAEPGDLYRIATNGGGLERLTDNPALDRQPAVGVVAED